MQIRNEGGRIETVNKEEAEAKAKRHREEK